MNDQFILYIDRLSQGKAEQIKIATSPDFMEVFESDLYFEGQVDVQGQAYIVESHLVIHVDIKASCVIPCSLCNSKIKHTLFLTGQYYTIPLGEITPKGYDFSTHIRESLLLEIPQYLKCTDGNCPEKDKIEKYLKKSARDTNYPFADLEC